MIRLITLLVSYCPRVNIKARFVDNTSVNPVKIKENYGRGSLTLDGRRTYSDIKRNAKFHREYIEYYNYRTEVL